jgi:branched-chain amino acid transport system permease protein
LAVTLVFVYQTTGLVHFAICALGAVAAFSFSSLYERINPWLALLVVVAGSAVVGIGLGYVSLPIQRSPSAVKGVLALAFVQTVIGFVPLIWTKDAIAIPTLSSARAFEVANVVISVQQVFTFVVALAAGLAIAALFRFGLLGAALRGVAANSNVARLVGLPVRRLWVLSWVLGTSAAGLAGVLIVPSAGMAAPTISLQVLYPLSAALVAGFRRPIVAVVVAFGLAIVSSLVKSQTGWLNVKLLDEPLSAYAGVLPFLVVVGALVIGRSGRFSVWERV